MRNKDGNQNIFSCYSMTIVPSSPLGVVVCACVVLLLSSLRLHSPCDAFMLSQPYYRRHDNHQQHRERPKRKTTFASKDSTEPEQSQSKYEANQTTTRTTTTTIETQCKNNDKDDVEYRNRHKRWLVLVDDEESIRMAVGDFLYDAGYMVTACSDATALVELVSRFPPSLPSQALSPSMLGQSPQQELLPIPDVIISDIRMPGKDGLMLLKFIRENKRLERVPVVLLTAKGFTKDRIEGYNAGADVYLTKPFDPEELLAICDNLILRREQMTGPQGRMVAMQQDMANIKHLLKLNSANVVQKTDVYLTPAERSILEMVADGKMNSEMAQIRGVTPERIGGILQQLYTKTNTGTRTELLRWALKTGYVPKRRKPNE